MVSAGVIATRFFQHPRLQDLCCKTAIQLMWVLPLNSGWPLSLLHARPAAPVGMINREPSWRILCLASQQWQHRER